MEDPTYEPKTSYPPPEHDARPSLEREDPSTPDGRAEHVGAPTEYADAQEVPPDAGEGKGAS